MRGDLGMRFVRTDQDAVGFAEAGVNTQLLRVSRSYDDWLPAANVAVELRDDVLVRLAASQ